jgi:hypothetical protein
MSPGKSGGTAGLPVPVSIICRRIAVFPVDKCLTSPNKFVISTGEVMGLRPTLGDEKRLSSGNHSPCKRHPPLCHPDRSEA